MRKYLLPSALILAVALSWASAQVINKSIATSQDPTGAIGIDTNNNVYFPGHILTIGPGTPVASPCGVTAVTLTGTDTAGAIAVGSSAATSCVVTFSKAWLAAPTCLVVWVDAPLAAMSWATSTTALTITQTSTASNHLNYFCTGAK